MTLSKGLAKWKITNIFLYGLYFGASDHKWRPELAQERNIFNLNKSMENSMKNIFHDLPREGDGFVRPRGLVQEVFNAILRII